MNHVVPSLFGLLYRHSSETGHCHIAVHDVYRHRLDLTFNVVVYTAYGIYVRFLLTPHFNGFRQS